MSARLQFEEVAARCEASTSPLVWADVYGYATTLHRLEHDADRVAKDVELLPRARPLASALGRLWWDSVLRRREDAGVLRRKIARLMGSDRSAASDALAAAEEHAGRWLVIPGGSERDG